MLLSVGEGRIQYNCDKMFLLFYGFLLIFLFDIAGRLKYNYKVTAAYRGVARMSCDFKNAVMAQQVEHVLGKDEVAGSNPANSSIKRQAEAFGSACLFIYIFIVF